MEWVHIGVVLLGALAGGFVSGLAGFGTGITALGIWLYVLEPQTAATLVVVCSVISQALTLPRILPQIEPRRVFPFILPGLIGVPFGVLLLSQMDARGLKIAVGVFLLFFTVFMLLVRQPRPISWGGRTADGVIGFAGGVLGGFAGMSGPIPTMWVTLRGWAKAESRSVFQAFNLSILCAAFILHIINGFFTMHVVVATLAALPGTLLGAQLGAKAYERLSDRRFREFILVLLCISGVTLVVSSLR